MMKPSGIGGQAVMEGVMMKNGDTYAVAVRCPDQKIKVKTSTFASFGDKVRLFKLPFFRGMLAFIESMELGTRTLDYSASLAEDEDQKPDHMEQAMKKVFGARAEKVMTGLTLVLSLLAAVVIFMMLPYFLSNLLAGVVKSSRMLILIEGLIRIAIFILYVLLISLMKEIHRIFMYHGAEHKTINCVEHGLPLTVENVRKQTKRHKRCGTSFMLIVMFVSVLFFMLIQVKSPWLRILYRILLLPVISGVSYEFIRLAGRSDSAIVNVLSQPGLWLQALTTREPDDDMIEVAIASVEAVFDWRAFEAGMTAEPARHHAQKTERRPQQEAPASARKTEGRRAETDRREMDQDLWSDDEDFTEPVSVKPVQNASRTTAKPAAQEVNGFDVKPAAEKAAPAQSVSRAAKSAVSGHKNEYQSEALQEDLKEDLKEDLQQRDESYEAAEDIEMELDMEADEDDEFLSMLDHYKGRK